MALGDEQHLRRTELEVRRRSYGVDLVCSSRERLKEIGAFVDPSLERAILSRADAQFYLVFSPQEWRRICVFAWRPEPHLLWITDLSERKRTRLLCEDVRSIVRASMPLGECNYQLMKLTVPTLPPSSIPPIHPPSSLRSVPRPLPSKKLPSTSSPTPVKRTPIATIPLPLEYADSIPLMQFLRFLRTRGFSPFVDLSEGRAYRRVRHPAMLAFCEELRRSNALYPRDWFDHQFPARSRHHQPVVLGKYPRRAWRERLSFLYWGKLLVEPNGAVVDELIDVLQDMEQAFSHDVLAHPIPSLEGHLWEVATYRETSKEALWEGNTKNIGFMARDSGQIGSFPLADDYGDEGSPNDQDNEWYDRF